MSDETVVEASLAVVVAAAVEGYGQGWRDARDRYCDDEEAED